MGIKNFFQSLKCKTLSCKGIFQSRVFNIAMWTVAGFFLILLLVQIGIIIGFKKAQFSYKWGDNYHQNFAGPKRGFLPEYDSRDFMDAHGTSGRVIKTDGNFIIINGRDNVEKIIKLNADTIIQLFKNPMPINQLMPGMEIVVIGEPNDLGQIEAKFVRVLPPPPAPAPNFYQPNHKR